MAEYIEREAVMQKFADHVKRSNNSDFAPIPTWNQAVQIVEDSPAADVREVKRGKWQHTTEPCGWSEYECASCSVCGDSFILDEWGMDDFTSLMNFCPNCGAEMREDADETLST